MAQLSEEFVKNRVVEWLGKHDYVISNVKTLSEHGVDIKAKKSRSNNFFLIECKGEPQNNPKKMRYPALVSVLGEILQRMKYRGHVKYGIALPETYREIVLKKIPWVLSKRLSLEILLVNNEGLVFRLTWKDIKGNKGHSNGT